MKNNAFTPKFIGFIEFLIDGTNEGTFTWQYGAHYSLFCNYRKFTIYLWALDEGHLKFKMTELNDTGSEVELEVVKIGSDNHCVEYELINKLYNTVILNSVDMNRMIDEFMAE